MKGRVAVLQKYGGDFDLREYPVPDPEPGAVLVRLTHAGICGSDLHIWRGEMKGLYGETPKDLTFGHEMCGRVERLGAGVTTDSLGAPLREGDRVTYCYFFPCGRCPVCLQDEMGACPRKGRANRVAGTPPYFNNAYGDYYYLRPGHFIFRLPEEIPDVMATPANCALAQVIYGFKRAGLRFGHTVVVQGAGGLGINAVAVARDMGADQVLVVDGVPERLALARDFGADHTLSLRELDTPERRIQAVMDLTGGFGADVVADFVGYPQVVPGGPAHAARRGHLSGSRQHLAGQCLLVRRHRARARRGAAGRRVQLLAVGPGGGAGLSRAHAGPLPLRARDLARVPAGADQRGLPRVRLAPARGRRGPDLARGAGHG